MSPRQPWYRRLLRRLMIQMAALQAGPQAHRTLLRDLARQTDAPQAINHRWRYRPAAPNRR